MELDLIGLFKMFAQAVVAGSVPASSVAVLVVIALVALIRKVGPEVHRLLPDHTIVDKGLAFLFDSKPGGWLLNALTTAAVGLAAVIGANPSAPLTLAVVGPILGGAFTVAGVFEFLKDLFFAPPPPPAVPGG